MSPKRPRGVKYEEAIGKTITSFEVFGPQDMDQWCSVNVEFDDRTLLVIELGATVHASSELIERTVEGDLGETLKERPVELLEEERE
jgi:hypothetical protein